MPEWLDLAARLFIVGGILLLLGDKYLLSRENKRLRFQLQQALDTIAFMRRPPYYMVTDTLAVAGSAGPGAVVSTIESPSPPEGVDFGPYGNGGPNPDA